MDITKIKEAKCFIIRSNSADDVHKVKNVKFILLYRLSNMVFGQVPKKL